MRQFEIEVFDPLRQLHTRLGLPLIQCEYTVDLSVQISCLPCIEMIKISIFYPAT